MLSQLKNNWPPIVWFVFTFLFVWFVSSIDLGSSTAQMGFGSRTVCCTTRYVGTNPPGCYAPNGYYENGEGIRFVKGKRYPRIQRPCHDGHWAYMDADKCAERLENGTGCGGTGPAPAPPVSPIPIPPPDSTPPPPPCESGADCNDNDICTSDVCIDGSCQHIDTGTCCKDASDCNDGNACTDDICIQATGSCSNPDNETCCNSDSECQEVDPACGQCGSCTERVNCSCNTVPVPGAPRFCGLSPPPFSYTTDASCSSGCDPGGDDCSSPCEVCLLETINIPGAGCVFSCQPAPNAEILWPDECGTGGSSTSTASVSSGNSSSESSDSSMSLSSESSNSSNSSDTSSGFSFSTSVYNSNNSSVTTSTSLSSDHSGSSQFSSFSSSSPCPSSSASSISQVSSEMASSTEEEDSSESSSSFSSKSMCYCSCSSTSSSSSSSSDSSKSNSSSSSSSDTSLFRQEIRS